MASYSTNDLRNGYKVLIDGDPCVILDCDFVKPGKGQAFTRVRIRNLKTERVVERTYKSNETIESADVVEREMQYLYNDGESWHFMDPNTFEQIDVVGKIVGESSKWLKEQDMCYVTLWNGAPLMVAPPNFVILEIVETDPGLRGDTSSGGTKPATLSTGAVVKVPLFLQTGELIKVDTRKAEYVSRAKE